MENAIQLANRFRDVTLSGKWIANTNFKQLIVDLDWEQATTKISSLNTIAALTFHINYYTAGILNVFNGGDLEIRDKFSFDCPTINSQADWEQLRDEFCDNGEQFATHVSNMDDLQLAAPFVKKEYGDYRRNIEGVIEHTYYHLGQVSLIKKMVLNKT